MQLIKYKSIFYITGLLSLLFVLTITGMWHNSPSYDEPKHLETGINLLEGYFIRYRESEMPITAMNALPLKLTERLSSGKYQSYFGTFKDARIVTSFFSVVLGLLIVWWAYLLYGMNGAYLSLFLYAFCPNVIAHSGIVGTDIYAALGVTASLFSFWHFLKQPNYPRAILSAFILGLSQTTKYTCLLLYIMLPVLYLLKNWPGIFSFFTGVKRAKINTVRRICNIFSFIVLFALINITVINSAFLFEGTGRRLHSYTFKSPLFQSIQKSRFVPDNIPVPFPKDYLRGLDSLIYNNKAGESYGNIYLLGELKKVKSEGSFPYYYLIAVLFKVPIAAQLLFFVSLFTLFCYIRRDPVRFCNNEVFLLFPILCYFIYLNLFVNAQIGIRYLMVVFPLAFIFCGILFEHYRNIHRIKKIILLILVMYQIISVLSYHPHYLSYFNELVTDRKRAYKILADSNIDWGQNIYYLENYMKMRPELQFAPSRPAEGKFVISVNRLTGVLTPPDYSWLRDNFEPVDHIAYSYLIYDITEHDLSRLRDHYK